MCVTGIQQNYGVKAVKFLKFSSLHDQLLNGYLSSELINQGDIEEIFSLLLFDGVTVLGLNISEGYG